VATTALAIFALIALSSSRRAVEQAGRQADEAANAVKEGTRLADLTRRVVEEARRQADETRKAVEESLRARVDNRAPAVLIHVDRPEPQVALIVVTGLGSIAAGTRGQLRKVEPGTNVADDDASCSCAFGLSSPTSAPPSRGTSSSRARWNTWMPPFRATAYPRRASGNTRGTSIASSHAER
jgi:hypothetical protein